MFKRRIVGLVEEECAEKMNVARTTVQRIYNDARKKLAECLVNGIVLKKERGDYQLCNEVNGLKECSKCHRNRHGRNGLNGNNRGKI